MTWHHAMVSVHSEVRTLEPVDRVTRRPRVSDDVLHVLRSVCGVWGLADARTARECARMEAAW